MPGPGSGLAGTLGIKTESGGYGTYTAPDHFHEVSSSPFKLTPNRVQGEGLDGLVVERDSRHQEVGRHGEGSIETLVFNKGMLMLFKHIFGTVVSGPTQLGGSAAYQTVFAITPTTTTDGLSLTAQVGLPQTDAAIKPRTGLGGKITSAEFANESGGQLKLACDLFFRDVTDAQTLAAPSFLTGLIPFSWPMLTVSLHSTYGSEVNISDKGVRGVSFKVGWALRDDRDYAGNAGLVADPLVNAKLDLTGNIDADFVDKTTFADRFANNTGTSMIWKWEGATIASSYKETVQLTMPRCKFTDTGEALEGPDILTGGYPFEVKYDDVNNPVTLTVISRDTAL